MIMTVHSLGFMPNADCRLQTQAGGRPHADTGRMPDGHRQSTSETVHVATWRGAIPSILSMSSKRLSANTSSAWNNTNGIIIIRSLTLSFWLTFDIDRLLLDLNTNVTSATAYRAVHSCPWCMILILIHGWLGMEEDVKLRNSLTASMGWRDDRAESVGY